MIDSAVPMEAIQGSTANEPAMIPSAWQSYSNRLYASDWWQLFANTDARSTVTWSNRLGYLGSVDIYNFYSSGEEVLREDTDDPPSGILSGGATQLINYYGASVPFGTYAWVWEEKGKGNAAHDDFISSSHGGWKFSSYWVDSYGNPLSPAIMNDTTNTTLQGQPMFNFNSTANDFLLDIDSELLGVVSGVNPSTYAQANRNRILSDAIPALTLPVGANSVSILDQPGHPHNFNITSSTFQNGWPSSRTTGDEAYKWHHSDFDYVAYPFTYKVFNQIVNSGNLK
jgi:hypothetical protein